MPIILGTLPYRSPNLSNLSAGKSAPKFFTKPKGVRALYLYNVYKHALSVGLNQILSIVVIEMAESCGFWKMIVIAFFLEKRSFSSECSLEVT